MEDRLDQLKSKFPGMAGSLTIMPKLASLVMALFRDPEVPRWLKLMTAGTITYVALPFDFLPDFVPMVGKGDDIVVMLLILVQYMKFCPPDVVERHWRATMGDDYDMEESLRKALEELDPLVTERYGALKNNVESLIGRLARKSAPAQPQLPHDELPESLPDYDPDQLSDD